MAEYGECEYGVPLYGSLPCVHGPDLADVEFIADNVLRFTFTTEMVVDDAYFEVSNYTVAFADSVGTDVNPRFVIPPTAGITDTNVVLLRTDAHTPGTNYSFTVSTLKRRNGSVMTTGTAIRPARKTKTNSMIRSLPQHFDKRPESTIRLIMTAIALEDELIGGNRSILL